MNQLSFPAAGERARYVESLEAFEEIHRALSARAAVTPERRALEGLESVLALVTPEKRKPGRVDLGGFTAFRASLETLAEHTPEARALHLFEGALRALMAAAGDFDDLPDADEEPVTEVMVEAGDEPDAELERAQEPSPDPAEAVGADREVPPSGDDAAEAPEEHSEPSLEVVEGQDADDTEDDIQASAEAGEPEAAVAAEGEVDVGVEVAAEAMPDPAETAAAAEARETPQVERDGASEPEQPFEAVDDTVSARPFEADDRVIDATTGEIRRRIAELETELAATRAQLAA
jgi:hypothetical protein